MFNYIPTSALLSLFGLSQTNHTAYEKFKIKALDHMGNDFPIMGVSELSLQYAPEKLQSLGRTIDYLTKDALGMLSPTLHYTGGKKKPITIDFSMVDSYEGPPHATVDSDGNINYVDFADLNEVEDWLESLGRPMLAWNKPPYVRFQMGRYMKTGVLTDIDSNIISAYPDGSPAILECRLVLQPDVIMVTAQQSVMGV